MAEPTRRPAKRVSPTIQLEVTAEAISRAVRRDSSHCMIADALKGVLSSMAPDRYSAVSVDLYSVSFTDRVKNVRYHYDTPRVGQLGLIDFDQGRVPEPFRLTLRAARKITRSNVAPKPGETPEQFAERKKRYAQSSQKANGRRAAADHVDAQSSGDRATKLRSTLDLLKLVDDPSAPLGPPRHIEQDGITDGTVIGGLPPAKSNFARKRRFGLKTLAA